ncbi:MAG: hypothetical protein WA902_15250 [Thermosynechococcaceae cyanobacterium]
MGSLLHDLVVVRFQSPPLVGDLGGRQRFMLRMCISPAVLILQGRTIAIGFALSTLHVTLLL